jgi:hypothetical protein
MCLPAFDAVLCTRQPKAQRHLCGKDCRRSRIGRCVPKGVHQGMQVRSVYCCTLLTGCCCCAKAAISACQVLEGVGARSPAVRLTNCSRRAIVRCALDTLQSRAVCWIASGPAVCVLFCTQGAVFVLEPHGCNCTPCPALLCPPLLMPYLSSGRQRVGVERGAALRIEGAVR